jgi:hypothetical protein
MMIRALCSTFLWLVSLGAAILGLFAMVLFVMGILNSQNWDRSAGQAVVGFAGSGIAALTFAWVSNPWLSQRAAFSRNPGVRWMIAITAVAVGLGALWILANAIDSVHVPYA